MDDKSLPSVKSIEEMYENLTEEQKQGLMDNLNKHLSDMDKAHKEYERTQREFFGRCNCPNYCYFHTLF